MCSLHKTWALDGLCLAVHQKQMLHIPETIVWGLAICFTFVLYVPGAQVQGPFPVESPYRLPSLLHGYGEPASRRTANRCAALNSSVVGQEENPREQVGWPASLAYGSLLPFRPSSHFGKPGIT